MRRMSADGGSFAFGANVKVGYFDQSLESLRGGKTVIDEIWDEHRVFTETKVRSYLSLFLFRGDDVFKNVDALSGGEKAKLCLLKLMLSGATCCCSTSRPTTSTSRRGRCLRRRSRILTAR